MIRFGPILFANGVIVAGIGGAMGLVAVFDALSAREAAGAFAGSALVTVFAGGALAIANRAPDMQFDQRQAFVLTVLAWISASAFGAIPFVAALGISYTDAFFETMSGLTTTGSSVLSGLDTMAPSVLLWRSLTHWIGGFGIIVLAIAILPFLRVAGMQLFKTESSDKSEKVLPRPGQVAAATGQVYLLLSIACTLCYHLAGMDWFDAVNHSMATLGTGGFSTSDASLGNWGDPEIHWVAIVFMALGGMPMVTFVKMLQGRPLAIARDPQVLAYLAVIAVSAAAIALWLHVALERPFAPEPAIRVALFNVVSIITTTGFALGDFNLWGGFPLMILLFLMFVGACSGSTAGGIKVFRLQIIWIAVRMQVLRMVHPHAILPRQYMHMKLSDELIAAVVIFANLYVLTVVLIGAGVAATGVDFVTAFTGATTAVSNVGPGFGPVIGPAGNFSTLPDAAKWLLSLGMMLGRLELMTVFVLLAPGFWRG